MFSALSFDFVVTEVTSVTGRHMIMFKLGFRRLALYNKCACLNYLDI